MVVRESHHSAELASQGGQAVAQVSQVVGAIEQSPLSRAIKELEEELGVVLFARTTRSTRLTHAGTLLLEHVRRGGSCPAGGFPPVRATRVVDHHRDALQRTTPNV